MASSSPSSEKTALAEAEIGQQPEHHDTHHRHDHHLRSKELEEIERIDALAMAQGTTLESFAHLDEKKILRKVGRRWWFSIETGLTSREDGPASDPDACASLSSFVP